MLPLLHILMLSFVTIILYSLDECDYFNVFYHCTELNTYLNLLILPSLINLRFLYFASDIYVIQKVNLYKLGLGRAQARAQTMGLGFY
jgi:hypothetical protein